MREAIEKLVRRMPLSFRVLYRQFLLRVIDLEALSIEADIPRFLGQFAGILLMYSLIRTVGGFFLFQIHPPTTPADLQMLSWTFDQQFIWTTMLVVGLIAVVSWDNVFPDRRDAMVLSPLPVRPVTILSAKVAASCAVIGIAIVSLNIAAGISWPLMLSGFAGAIRFIPAYWFTLVAASAFLYGSILTIQGFAALLPRRYFLRLSATLQLCAFGGFLAAFFLLPYLTTTDSFLLAANRSMITWAPPYWFFALFNQLNGSLPRELEWMAWRGWAALGFAMAGAGAALFSCYTRTMRRTIEEPDLLPARRGAGWSLPFAPALQKAILPFSLRSIVRSRHHRVACAFYLAIVFSIALSMLHAEWTSAAARTLSPDFLIPTYMMVVFSIFGLRAVFALPVSLTANWVWRITQLNPSPKYAGATRATLFAFAVVPVLVIVGALSYPITPAYQAGEHLLVLAILGLIGIEVALFGFYKVPFTCSYLPGKVNIQFIFWGGLVVFTAIAITAAQFEVGVLGHPWQFAVTVVGLGAVAAALWGYNFYRARSAVLYFEELPEDVIITLKIGSIYNAE